MATVEALLKRLNSDFLDLIAVRSELNDLSYNDDKYDEIEEEVQDFEDTFLEKYGKLLDKIILKIHAHYCPDIESLLPTAYIAKKYLQSPINEGEYEVSPKDGIVLNTIFDDAQMRPIKVNLTILPSPFRFVMFAKGDAKVIWNEQTPEVFSFETLD